MLGHNWMQSNTSFVAAVIALFSGEFLGSLGFFFLSFVLNGVARGLNS